MFRIDRDLVKLGAVKTARTIRIDSEVREDSELTEAGVAGETPDAAASATAMAQVIRSTAEAEAKAKARELIREAKTKAETEAEAILEDARREAGEIKLAAREESDDERRRAHEEGFREGAEEGRRSYDERLEAKTREMAEELNEKLSEDEGKLQRVISELYEERTRTFNGLEEQVVGLAMDIVRKVVNPVEEETGGAFDLLIRNALKQINPDGKVIIRVGPADYERFFTSGGAVFELGGGVTVTASVLRDASLGECDCVIDTEEETVNAGLESQLKYIRLAFDRA